MKRKKLNLLLLFVLIFSAQNCQSQDLRDNILDTPLMKGKKILIVYGGWEGHSPKEFTEINRKWIEEEGADVTLSETLDIYLDEEFLKSQDLIIQAWTQGEITNEQRKSLLNAVKSGVGFAGSHGGTGDSFRKSVAFQYLVGGQWIAHPGGQIDFTVNIRDKEDDVTRGLADFKVHSEQYYMLVDPNIKVLATTKFSGEHDDWIEGAVIPVVWKKYFGKGRVFYYSAGHNMTDYDIKESRMILQRGFRWASESKYHPVEDWLRPVYK